MTQLALDKTEMVDRLRVFLPFATEARRQTLYDHVQANPRFLFGSGPEEHSTERPGAWAYCVKRTTVL
jgi:hypothetical protein